MKSRLLLLAAAIVLSLMIGEGLARVSLRASSQSGFADPAAFYAYHLNLTKWEGGNWLRNLEPHPYFGYVMTQAGTAANNHGFNDPEPFPYKKKTPNDFVISVLGGSVALGWGGWIQNLGKNYFVAELKKRVPALAKRDIVILDMAMGGYKQPQQLNIASYFLDSVDLFINLEGHNELNAFTNQPVFPVEFPIGAYLYFWQSRQAVEASRALRFYGRLNQVLIEGGNGSALLRNSALYFSVTKAVFAWVTNRSIASAEQAKAAYEKELATPVRSFYPADTRARDPLAAAVSAWERFATQEQRLAKGSSAQVIFFLQPNQYLHGSKPLSEWERKNAITSDFLRKNQEYSLLPLAVKRLQAAGVNMHDLTQVFSAENDTVYADSCCHVNEKGNRLMSEAIAKKIGQVMKFR